MKIIVNGKGTKILEFQKEMKDVYGVKYQIMVKEELPTVLRFNPDCVSSAIFYLYGFLNFDLLKDKKYKQLEIKISTKDNGYLKKKGSCSLQRYKRFD